MNGLHIGTISLKSNIVYAPLAGFSDFPFRCMSTLGNPALMFCEMVKVEGLIRKIPKTFQILDYDETMRPIGGQICGSHPDEAGIAAKMIEDLGFDLVDLNCGCPTDRITKDGSGSGLLKNPSLMGKIIEKMVSSINIPVTAKIRVGWDAASINVEEVVQILVDSGVSAIFVHGRTRAQGYTGISNRTYIAAAKRAAATVPVFGNGDLFEPRDAQGMLLETGVDGVLLARGTIGSPLIGKEVLSFLRSGQYEKKSFIDNKLLFLKHLEAVESYYKSDYQTITAAKKLCGYYLIAHPGVKALRAQFTKINSVVEIFSLLKDFE